jgi:uncharacterized protein (UPF0261 family)
MNARAMHEQQCILVVGTCDTKADELLYVRACLAAAGGEAFIMDVGVLGDPVFVPDISNREVAATAGSTIEEIAGYGDENLAMAKMADGAARMTRRLYEAGRVHGVLILGGTMGTDLALDVAAALPLGVPKMLVSTISFSHLIPPERIAPDLMMILWSGGLYGLNSICRAILGQAAGAVLGACRATTPPRYLRPLVAITSLGKSCLSYMVRLKPELEARGYEVAVFHTTGMGGRAFEALAAQGRFVAVMDFSLQELSNQVHGSVVNSGADRLGAAGRAGIPQIIAPGATDMIDVPAWQALSPCYQDRPFHAHNRLIASVLANSDERRQTARRIVDQLSTAKAPVTLILPRGGIQEWDRPGALLHDAEGLAAMFDEVRTCVRPPVRLLECDAHINDAGFADAALGVFDTWMREGTVQPGAPVNER